MKAIGVRWQGANLGRLTMVIIAGFLLALAGCSKPSKIKYTVNDPKDPNTTWKTERPLTYAEAISFGHCPIALPGAATNIQYIDFYAGYGGFSQFVRFEAPVGICGEHAKKVLEACNRSQAGTNLLVLVSASAFDKSTAKSLARWARERVEPEARAPWFDADEINHGEIFGENGSHKPIILVDTDRGVFYYSLSD